MRQADERPDLGLLVRAPRARARRRTPRRSAASAGCGWPSPSSTAPDGLCGHRAEERGAARLRQARRARRPPSGPRPVSLAASMISTHAASSAARRARISRLRHHPADRRRRGVHLALRQPQQREPRMRIASPAAALPVELLRLVRLAPQPVELPSRYQAPPIARFTGGPARQSHARSTSPSASGHAPWSCSSSARWMRHEPR